jgi:hypothetical protein
LPWITAVLGPHLNQFCISLSSFVTLNPLFSLAVLDGDAVHELDQIDGTCNTEITAREKGNERSMVVYIVHSHCGPFR